MVKKRLPKSLSKRAKAVKAGRVKRNKKGQFVKR